MCNNFLEEPPHLDSPDTPVIVRPDPMNDDSPIIQLASDDHPEPLRPTVTHAIIPGAATLHSFEHPIMDTNDRVQGFIDVHVYAPPSPPQQQKHAPPSPPPEPKQRTRGTKRKLFELKGKENKTGKLN